MPDFDDFDDTGDITSSNLQDALNASNNNASSSLQIQGGNSSGSNLPTSSGVGPTLSAPPSPALSSYSDHHNTTSSSNNPLYELKTKRRGGLNGSNSSFHSFNNQVSGSSSNQNRSNVAGGARNSSRSPPSDYEDSHSMHSEDDLLFTRRHRQQSVDSLASVSTNASASSKKRNFNTALGGASSGNTGSTSPSNIPLGMQGHQPAKPSLTGLDFTNIRGGGVGGFSTPDSSHPGTPASEHEGIEMPGVGCLPPSLLFPLRHSSQNPYSSAEEDGMTTGTDDNDDDDDDDASGTDDEMDENIRFQHQLLLQQQQQQQQMLYNGPQSLNPQMLNGAPPMNTSGTQPMTMANMMQNQQQFNNMHMMGATPQQGGFNNNNQNFANMLGTTPTAEPSMKKKKLSSTATGGPSSGNKVKKNKGSVKYDAKADHAAAAMFSPLSLQGQGMNTGANIPMPTISASTSPTSQVAASAATLAAIQAAAAANAFPDASTPTGRVWIPNNAKPFKCPVPGCDKAYKQQNGLKYHRLHGHCNASGANSPGAAGGNKSGNGEDGEGADDQGEKEEDKPFGCYVGPACGKKYKK